MTASEIQSTREFCAPFRLGRRIRGIGPVPAQEKGCQPVKERERAVR